MPGIRAQAGDNTCFPALINLHFKPPRGGTLSDGRSGILSDGRRQQQSNGFVIIKMNQPCCPIRELEKAWKRGRIGSIAYTAGRCGGLAVP